MADVLLPTSLLLDRLGREEQHLKQLGLHATAAGVRVAITAMLRLADEGVDAGPPLDPSTDAS